MKLTIIDKYIAKELLIACVSVLFVLLLIVISTEVVRMLGWVVQGSIPLSALLPYLINSLFEFSVALMPLSLLMGVLIGFGRLYRDSEMAAILSAGIGPRQWYRPLMLVAVPTTIVLLLLMLYVRPIISLQRAQISAELESQAEIDTLLVGQFNYASEGGILFLESSDKKSNQVNNVFFQQHYNDEGHVDLATSTNTYYNDEGRRYMMMHDGLHYIGEAGDADYKIIKYKDYGIYIASKQVQAHLSEKSKPVTELWGSNKVRDQSELQWRLALPLATIIVAFMALPLSHSSPRSGRFGKLALALVLYLLYSNFLGIGKTWIIQERVPVWLGLWWVHLTAIMFTVYLLKRSGYLYGLSFNKKTEAKAKDALDGY